MKEPVGVEVLEGGEALRVVYVRVGEVVKWGRNAKVHDMEGLKASIRKYGMRDAPVWDGTLEATAAGNGRAQALLEMEAADEEIPRGVLVARDDGGWCMPLQVGVDAGSVAEAEAFAIDHNNLTLGGAFGAGEVSLMWDEEYLGLVEELQRGGTALITLDDTDLELIRRARQMPLPMDPDVPEPRLDEAEKLLAEWGVERGQVWGAGQHRIMCGDSTDPADVEALCGGRTIEWLWTDPPYGVAYVGRTRDKLTIEGDEIEGTRRMLDDAFGAWDPHMAEGAPIYVCHPSGLYGRVFTDAFEGAGWHLHQTLVWAKDVMVIGHSDYNYQHETILYGWKGKNRVWYGGRDKVSVFQVDRPGRSTFHPTTKPVPLIMPMLANSSAYGALGCDPFLGSGSTILAANTLSRVCYGCDIEPKYVAVTLQRLKEAGLEPERITP